MKYAPQMLGAVALATIGGALSGAAIGDTDMLTRGHHETLPKTAPVFAGNAALHSGQRPPDHYPLETPYGTIEVAELALHGRMRNAVDPGWWEDRSRMELGAEYDFYAQASDERIAREEALLAFTGDRQPLHARRVEHAAIYTATDRPLTRTSRAEAPMALAEPAEIPTPPAAERVAVLTSREPSSGNAKTIDVAAALAVRD